MPICFARSWVVEHALTVALLELLLALVKSIRSRRNAGKTLFARSNPRKSIVMDIPFRAVD